MRYENLQGRRFGRLTVVEYLGSDKGCGSLWLCECACGTTKVIRARNLKEGTVQSCGCLNKEKLSERVSSHGKSSTRIYRIWKAMNHRCYKSYDSAYQNYGGRGITVCDEWRSDFQAFYNWSMANGYSDEASIDRIDNNGNYSPENCRWVGRDVQSNNKRNNLYLTYNGRTQTITEWSREIGINSSTLRKRIRDGWSVERTLTTKKMR